MAITAVLPRREAQRRVAAATVVVAAVAATLAWRGWQSLSTVGPVHAIRAGQAQLAGPVVIGFVLVVFAIEQVAPAERRPLAARGHLLDLGYLLVHGVLVVPLIVLIGTGFSAGLAAAAPWLLLPRVGAIPNWVFGIATLVGIDAVDWFVHFANHRIGSLWRLHAVHHSQEELSILSTFRTHPLVHVTFVVSAVPVLAVSRNVTTPAVLLTAYACLGSLPHANLRWRYGWVGRYVVSPAYHRRHHSPTGRLDVNLGTVLTVWDRMTRRAIDPPPATPVAPTGLAGRPIPVEQHDGRPLVATFIAQWTQPFLSPSGAPQ